MSKSEFAAAKAIWADLTETKEDLMSLRKSLFGDEYDFMFKHLDEEWLTTVKSVCDNNNCTNTISDGRPEHGCICLGYVCFVLMSHTFRPAKSLKHYFINVQVSFYNFQKRSLK
jgi:hypothetical protein